MIGVMVRVLFSVRLSLDGLGDTVVDKSGAAVKVTLDRLIIRVDAGGGGSVVWLNCVKFGEGTDVPFDVVLGL